MIERVKCKVYVEDIHYSEIFTKNCVNYYIVIVYGTFSVSQHIAILIIIIKNFKKKVSKFIFTQNNSQV